MMHRGWTQLYAARLGQRDLPLPFPLTGALLRSCRLRAGPLPCSSDDVECVAPEPAGGRKVRDSLLRAVHACKADVPAAGATPALLQAAAGTKGQAEVAQYCWSHRSQDCWSTAAM